MAIAALGLDVGRKRIGVAGCDATGLIAFGITTIHRKSFQDDVAQLRQLAQDRDIDTLIVGLPYSMDGTIGTQAKHIQKFAKAIAAELQLPIIYVDERFTSFEAEQQLQAEGISPSRRKELIDRKAAAIILQQWLDEQRAEQRRGEEGVGSRE